MRFVQNVLCQGASAMPGVLLTTTIVVRWQDTRQACHQSTVQSICPIDNLLTCVTALSQAGSMGYETGSAVGSAGSQTCRGQASFCCAVCGCSGCGLSHTCLCITNASSAWRARILSQYHTMELIRCSRTTQSKVTESNVRSKRACHTD
jgi:hypothetical protein